jgi:hypothetical protein
MSKENFKLFIPRGAESSVEALGMKFAAQQSTKQIEIVESESFG